jgi:hypothetical protein
MIRVGATLTNVVQVMLRRRLLPCQQRAAPMWSWKPEDPATVLRFYGTTHEKLWKVLFKPEKEWPPKEEDIGLDAAHPPKEVTKIRPIVFGYFLVDKPNHFLSSLAGLAGQGHADRQSGPTARRPQLVPARGNADRGAVQGAREEGERKNGEKGGSRRPPLKGTPGHQIRGNLSPLCSRGGTRRGRGGERLLPNKEKGSIRRCRGGTAPSCPEEAAQA